MLYVLEVKLDNLIKLIIAAVLGGLIGIERQVGGQYAGFRTQLLVCLGSCLFTIASLHVHEVYGKNTDPSRIAAQIVVGIGFLGAGVILKHGVTIRGLTTAATLWIVSAIGMAVGLGQYLIALFTFFLVFLTLVIFRNIEDLFPRNRYSTLLIRSKGVDELKISEFLKEFNVKILDSKVRFYKKRGFIEQEFSIRYRNDSQLREFLKILKDMPDILEFHVS